LPFLTFGFFAGVRPEGELQKLKWSDIHLDDRKIVMRPEITKKNRRRFIDIQPNALEWLAEYRNRGGSMEGPVVKLSGSQIQTRRLTLRKSVGVDVWPNSGMRHNFCSCHLAKFKDQNSLCLQSGLTPCINTTTKRSSKRRQIGSGRYIHRSRRNRKLSLSLLPPDNQGGLVHIGLVKMPWCLG
jgi:integrase